MTSSWRGRAHIKMDAKGRLSLPTSFRGPLGKSSQVFITNSLYKGHRYLDFYIRAEWEKLEKKIARWPRLKPEVQAFQRFYISSVEACQVDGQGRVLIPPHLRQYAGLEEDIVLVGMDRKIEIWQEKTWRDLFAKLENDFEGMLNILAGFDEREKGRK